LRVPALCPGGDEPFDGPFAKACHASGFEELSALEQLTCRLDESDRERAMCVLSHVVSACAATGDVPTPLTAWRQALADSLGRSIDGFSDNTDLVLTNWAFTTIDEDARLSWSSAQHMHIVFCFVASADEDWYRKLHVLLHGEARDLVRAVRLGQRAMADRNDRGFIQSLEDIGVWLAGVCEYFEAQFAGKDSRGEPVMWARLRCFTAPREEEAKIACWIYSMGSSVILPALHAVLGIHVASGTGDAGEPARPTTLQRYWAEVRGNMPRAHQAFLEELEAKANNMRRYCLLRFRSPSVSVEHLHDLELAYNDVLSALMRFCSLRYQLVLRFCPEIKRTGTLHAEEEQAIERSRLQLLLMRKRRDLRVPQG